MEILQALVIALIYLVIVALVIGVAVWAIQRLFPEAPPIIVNALYVLGVLIALLLILRIVLGGDLGIPRVR